jgi:hypothetical protein
VTRPTPPERLRAPTLETTGIPWFREEDYARILHVMDDARLLPARHADWQKQAIAAEQRLQAMGVRTLRVVIEPFGFADWCRARGLRLDAQARMHYARETLRTLPSVA